MQVNHVAGKGELALLSAVIKDEWFTRQSVTNFAAGVDHINPLTTRNIDGSWIANVLTTG